ncbi:hypothetical protein ABK040_011964 [Willaertia magna]
MNKIGNSKNGNIENCNDFFNYFFKYISFLSINDVVSFIFLENDGLEICLFDFFTKFTKKVTPNNVLQCDFPEIENYDIFKVESIFNDLNNLQNLNIDYIILNQILQKLKDSKNFTKTKIENIFLFKNNLQFYKNEKFKTFFKIFTLETINILNFKYFYKNSKIKVDNNFVKNFKKLNLEKKKKLFLFIYKFNHSLFGNLKYLNFNKNKITTLQNKITKKEETLQKNENTKYLNTEKSLQKVEEKLQEIDNSINDHVTNFRRMNSNFGKFQLLQTNALFNEINSLQNLNQNIYKKLQNVKNEISLKNEKIFSKNNLLHFTFGVPIIENCKITKMNVSKGTTLQITKFEEENTEMVIDLIDKKLKKEDFLYLEYFKDINAENTEISIFEYLQNLREEFIKKFTKNENCKKLTEEMLPYLYFQCNFSFTPILENMKDNLFSFLINYCKINSKRKFIFLESFTKKNEDLQNCFEFLKENLKNTNLEKYLIKNDFIFENCKNEEFLQNLQEILIFYKKYLISIEIHIKKLSIFFENKNLENNYFLKYEISSNQLDELKTLQKNLKYSYFSLSILNLIKNNNLINLENVFNEEEFTNLENLEDTNIYLETLQYFLQLIIKLNIFTNLEIETLQNCINFPNFNNEEQILKYFNEINNLFFNLIKNIYFTITVNSSLNNIFNFLIKLQKLLQFGDIFYRNENFIKNIKNRKYQFYFEKILQKILQKNFDKLKIFCKEIKKIIIYLHFYNLLQKVKDYFIFKNLNNENLQKYYEIYKTLQDHPFFDLSLLYLENYKFTLNYGKYFYFNLNYLSRKEFYHLFIKNNFTKIFNYIKTENLKNYTFLNLEEKINLFTNLDKELIPINISIFNYFSKNYLKKLKILQNGKNTLQKEFLLIKETFNQLNNQNENIKNVISIFSNNENINYEEWLEILQKNCNEIPLIVIPSEHSNYFLNLEKIQNFKNILLTSLQFLIFQIFHKFPVNCNQWMSFLFLEILNFVKSYECCHVLQNLFFLKFENLNFFISLENEQINFTLFLAMHCCKVFLNSLQKLQKEVTEKLFSMCIILDYFIVNEVRYKNYMSQNSSLNNEKLTSLQCKEIIINFCNELINLFILNLDISILIDDDFIKPYLENLNLKNILKDGYLKLINFIFLEFLLQNYFYLNLIEKIKINDLPIKEVLNYLQNENIKNKENNNFILFELDYNYYACLLQKINKELFITKKDKLIIYLQQIIIFLGNYSFSKLNKTNFNINTLQYIHPIMDPIAITEIFNKLKINEFNKEIQLELGKLYQELIKLLINNKYKEYNEENNHLNLEIYKEGSTINNKFKREHEKITNFLNNH